MTRPLTGRDYHEYMLASKSDNRTRAAFQSAVLELVHAPSAILDFGAGTGIDAKVYAGAGHAVWAYDASREMHDYLVQHCPQEIDSGHIRVIDLTYDDLLVRGDVGPVNAITADFAVLNLIDGHERLFAAFDRWLTPEGFVLASVINPYCLGDARYGWWWQSLVRFFCTGRYSVGAGSGLSYRYSVTAFGRAARPYFVLDRVIPSLSVKAGKTLRGGSGSLLTSPFMFLLFRKARRRDP